MVDFYEQRNEPLGSIKSRVVTYQITIYFPERTLHHGVRSSSCAPALQADISNSSLQNHFYCTSQEIMFPPNITALRKPHKSQEFCCSWFISTAKLIAWAFICFLVTD